MTKYVGLLAVGIAIFALPEPAFAQASKTIARGAELWSATCNRCHNRRSPIERTDAQWDVIVSHMRTRANLTRSQARAITRFLKQSNGRSQSESGGSAARSRPDSSGARESDRAARLSGRRDSNKLLRLGPSVLGPLVLRDVLKSPRVRMDSQEQ